MCVLGMFNDIYFLNLRSVYHGIYVFQNLIESGIANPIAIQMFLVGLEEAASLSEFGSQLSNGT
jgi:hypothetical protein